MVATVPLGESGRSLADQSPGAGGVSAALGVFADLYASWHQKGVHNYLRAVSVPFRKVGTLRDHDITGGCVTEALEVFAEPLSIRPHRGFTAFEKADSLRVGGPRGPLDDRCSRGPQSSSLGLSHPSVGAGVSLRPSHPSWAGARGTEGGAGQCRGRGPRWRRARREQRLLVRRLHWMNVCLDV